jgi:hypothetical protein
MCRLMHGYDAWVGYIHVQNIFFIDVKDRDSLKYVQDKYYNPTYIQDKDCNMEIV